MSVIAIDGTFSSGKGTLAKQLAAHYGLPHLDTGKLYRAVARDVLAAGVSVDDADQAARIASRIDATTLDDPYLKSGEIGAAASKVSVHPAVRQALFEFQRDFAARGAVLDGRDIGTVICPGADVKLFVTASLEVRAQRRVAEMAERGIDANLDDIRDDLARRDERDANRPISPLKKADDAHLLDTTNLDIEAAVAAAKAIIDACLAQP